MGAGHLYEFTNTKEMQEVCNREFFKGGSVMSFNDAKAYCAFKGATLAIISSQKKQHNARRVCGRENCWIGLTFENGAWKWVNGDSLSYSNWKSGEPNGNAREVYGLLSEHDGKWYSYSGNNKASYSGNNKAKATPLCSKAPNDEKTEQTYTIVTSRSEIKEFVAEPLPFNAVANLNAYADNSIIKSLIIEPATTCQNRDECNVNMAQRFNFNNNMYVNDGDIPPHLSNVRCTNKYGCRSTDDKLKCCAAKCNSLFAGLHSNCPTGTTAKLKASEIPCKGTNCGLYTGNKCQIVVAFDRQGKGNKIVVDGNVKACGRSDIGCNAILSVKVIGRDCTALMFSSSDTECDDEFCDFTRPDRLSGKCCSNNQYGHCKTIHGQSANTAVWTDTIGCDNSDFIRLFSSEQTMSTKCTAKISKIKVGGDELLDLPQ